MIQETAGPSRRARESARALLMNHDLAFRSGTGRCLRIRDQSHLIAGGSIPLFPSERSMP